MRILAAWLTALAFAPAPAAALEIRSCHDVIRASPLNDERGVQSALVQTIAIVNNAKTAKRIASLDIELRAKGVIRDRRSLGAEDISKAIAAAPQIAAMNRIFPSQFCNGALLKGVSLAKSDLIAPGEAVVIPHQPFAWKGPRDTLSTMAIEEGGNAALAVAAAAIRHFPIVSEASTTKLLFPIPGRSYVARARVSSRIIAGRRSRNSRSILSCWTMARPIAAMA